MSNIYIQEPPTEGKICLETTAGDIDIELWSREAPKACRNFVQLCLEGYYDGTIFHRLVKGFIVQGGDPTGTGSGGNSVWGKPFKDEFHSRLRFVRRGLVAMANAGKDDNGSQFFFTLGATPELQSKHTLFAKVGGNTIYNMLKLEDGLTDENEKPLYPHKIIKTKVLSNPFPDIVPRETIKKVKDDKKEKSKSKAAATKNYQLLSFGEEAEEDEEETDQVNKKYLGKSKSIHDLAIDPKLSAQPAVESSLSKDKRRSTTKGSESSSSDKEEGDDDEQRQKKKRKRDSLGASGDEKEMSKRKEKEKEVQSVRDKLKRKEEEAKTSSSKKKDKEEKESSKSKGADEDDEEEYYLGKDEKMKQKKKVEELKKEFKELKKSMKREKDTQDKEVAAATKEAEDKAAKLAQDNSVIKEFLSEQEKYKQVKMKAPKKGEDREAMTLALLAKFKNKIETAKETFGDQVHIPVDGKGDKEDGEEEQDDEDKPDDISWLAKKLNYETSKEAVLAKDANLKSDDWFDIYDPRNSLSKRRRENSSQDSKEKKRSRINN